MTKWRRRKKGTRGAVLAEFVVAIVPVLTVFFGFLQMAYVATARLAVKNAAIVSARAAAVISNTGGNNPGQNGSPGDIHDAAILALAPWISQGSITNVAVDTQDQSSLDDPYALVTVTVTASYQCRVPLGRILCGNGKSMTETVSMPHQGARYKVGG